MGSFIDAVLARARADRQTIVLPEGDDARTLEAAQALLAQDVADLVILGDAETIRAAPYRLEKARIIDPRCAEERAGFAHALFELRRKKGMGEEEAFGLAGEVLHFGTLMVKLGHADGMVCGACHSTSDVLRAALQIIKTTPGTRLVSAFFVMALPGGGWGQDNTLIFADCGLEIQPDAERLAHIALSSAASWETLMESEPAVAMLSHSTYGSAAKSADRDKVREAVEIARALAPGLAVDGELQLDAAIVPEIGRSKAPGSSVAGRANVLVFPDLDAGNIGYKLVQRLANAQAYGPITQGLAAPVNDLSRGCSAQDIVGVTAITCVQAQAQKAAVAH